MAEPKSFPALEQTLDMLRELIYLTDHVQDVTHGYSTMLKEADAELKEARELLAAAEKWEEYENKKTTYPRLRAAIAACQPGKQTASE